MTDAELDAAGRATSRSSRASRPEHKLRIVGGAAAAGPGRRHDRRRRERRAGAQAGRHRRGHGHHRHRRLQGSGGHGAAATTTSPPSSRRSKKAARSTTTCARFVKFSVAGNIGKVLVMLAWPFRSWCWTPLDRPVALMPLQLLWLNLLTDGLLGLGLGVEPAERGVMRRPPDSPQAGIFSGGMGLQVAWTGAFIGLVTLAVGYVYHQRHPDGPWQTVMFTTLALLQVFQAVATRSSRASLLAIGMFTNRVMLWTIGLVVGLQIAAL